jgi:4-amino-4-deoxy-L-arabinose transferase-like glycosyltransferase
MKPSLIFLLVTSSVGALIFWAIPVLQSVHPTLYMINLFPDGYDKIAMNLVQGHGYRFFTESTRTMLKTPLYPFILASIFYFFGRNLAAAQVLNIFLSVATAYYIFQISRHCLLKAGQKVRASRIMIPAVVFMLHPGVIMAESRAGVECLLMLLITALVYFLYRAVAEKSLAKHVIAGLLFGLAMLAKSSPVLFAFLLIPYIFWLSKHQPAGLRSLCINWSAFYLVCVLVYAPWIIRNYDLTDSLVPASTIKGFVAHQGLYLNQNYFSGKQAYLLFDEDSKQQNAMLDELGLKTYKRKYYKHFFTPKDEVEFDKYLWDDVIRQYSESPLLAVKSILLNATGFWFKGRTTAATMFNIVITLPLLIFFALGLLEAHAKKIDVLPIVLFVIAFILPHLFTLGLTRYHIPLIPLLIVVAALPFQSGIFAEKFFLRSKAKPGFESESVVV